MELQVIYTVGFVITYLIENNMYVFLVSVLTLVKYHVEFHKVRTWTFAIFVVC